MMYFYHPFRLTVLLTIALKMLKLDKQIEAMNIEVN